MNEISYHIKLTKTADKGVFYDHPIFEGYTVWGHCTKLPQVGECFQIFRYQRNDIALYGIMTTTEVKSVSEVIVSLLLPPPPHYFTFETVNSIYRLDFLPPFPLDISS